MPAASALAGRASLVLALLVGCTTQHDRPVAQSKPPVTHVRPPADAASEAAADLAPAQPAPSQPASAQVGPHPTPPTPTRPGLVGCPSDLAEPRTPTVRNVRALHVWRSRESVPACLAPSVPADVDFQREMLAAFTPGNGHVITIATPAKPIQRGKGHAVIDVEKLFQPCAPCNGGAYNPDDERKPPPVPQLTLWRLPRIAGVAVYLREKPHPDTKPCPICLAP